MIKTFVEQTLRCFPQDARIALCRGSIMLLNGVLDKTIMEEMIAVDKLLPLLLPFVAYYIVDKLPKETPTEDLQKALLSIIVETSSYVQ